METTQIDEAQHWYMLHSYSQWDIEVLEYTKDKDKQDEQTGKVRAGEQDTPHSENVQWSESTIG